MKIRITTVVLLLFFAHSAVIHAQKNGNNASVSPERYIAIADSLFLIKNYDGVSQNLRLALQAYPENTDILTRTAHFLFEVEDFEGAYQFYTAAIQSDSTSSRCWFNRGYFHYSVSAVYESIHDYERGIEHAKDDSTRHSIGMNLAAQYSAVREFEKSYRLVKEAHDYDPLDTDYLNNLAMVCDELDRRDEALNYLYRILELDKNHFQAMTNVGFLLQKNGDFEKSIEYFDKALTLNPRAALIYSNKSTSLLELGQLEDAMANITRSLELYPHNSWAYKTKARIHLAQGDEASTCESLELAIQLEYTRQYGDEVEELYRKHCLAEKH